MFSHAVLFILHLYRESNKHRSSGRSRKVEISEDITEHSERGTILIWSNSHICALWLHFRSWTITNKEVIKLGWYFTSRPQQKLCPSVIMDQIQDIWIFFDLCETKISYTPSITARSLLSSLSQCEKILKGAVCVFIYNIMWCKNNSYPVDCVCEAEIRKIDQHKWKVKWNLSLTQFSVLTHQYCAVKNGLPLTCDVLVLTLESCLHLSLTLLPFSSFPRRRLHVCESVYIQVYEYSSYSMF